MVLLNFGAVFMGTALTIRDLIGERPIFRREQAVGLSTTAYLLAKFVVFFVFATIQAAIATFIVRLGKGAPTAHPPFFDNSTFSLFVTVAGTCVASAMLGLLLRRSRSPTSRSCSCWWSRSSRSWCSPAG